MCRFTVSEGSFLNISKCQVIFRTDSSVSFSHGAIWTLFEWTMDKQRMPIMILGGLVYLLEFGSNLSDLALDCRNLGL
jgi:hypothetical protein